MTARVARFSWAQHTKIGKMYQMATKITNDQNIDKAAIKYTIGRPYKSNPKRDFVFENMTSGNPT
jgi:hypothetical protein